VVAWIGQTGHQAKNPLACDELVTKVNFPNPLGANLHNDVKPHIERLVFRDSSSSSPLALQRMDGHGSAHNQNKDQLASSISSRNNGQIYLERQQNKNKFSIACLRTEKQNRSRQ
jgi:hypothetical protein